MKRVKGKKLTWQKKKRKEKSITNEKARKKRLKRKITKKDYWEK